MLLYIIYIGNNVFNILHTHQFSHLCFYLLPRRYKIIFGFNRYIKHKSFKYWFKLTNYNPRILAVSFWEGKKWSCVKSWKWKT